MCVYIYIFFFKVIKVIIVYAISYHYNTTEYLITDLNKPELLRT